MDARMKMEEICNARDNNNHTQWTMAWAGDKECDQGMLDCKLHQHQYHVHNNNNNDDSERRMK